MDFDKKELRITLNKLHTQKLSVFPFKLPTEGLSFSISRAPSAGTGRNVRGTERSITEVTFVTH